MSQPFRVAFIGVDHPHGAAWRESLLHLADEVTIAALVPGLPGINTMDFLFVDNRYTFKKGVLTISGTSPSYPKAFVCSSKTGAAIDPQEEEIYR